MDTVIPPANGSIDSKGQRLNFSIDLRVVAISLLAIILAMLVAWHPWRSNATSTARTVSVTGETTLKATPDDYEFNPNYEFKNSDKAAAIKAAGDKQTELVAKLKTLGVADNHIQSSIDGYEDAQILPLESGQTIPVKVPGASGDYIYTLQFSVTSPTRAEAQKVQDYLATTAPSGSVTPNVQFSQALRKKLEAQARDTATKDARAKADQSAQNLGFHIGNVKSVDDGAGFGGGIMPMQSGGKATAMDSGRAASPSIAVQPGENDLSYSVIVVYYIK